MQTKRTPVQSKTQTTLLYIFLSVLMSDTCQAEPVRCGVVIAGSRHLPYATAREAISEKYGSWHHSA